MNNNLDFYSDNVERLASQYDSVSFESVHKDWLEFIPNNGSVLDIGAGSGRDARYLADKGLKVFAVEPVLPLMLNAIENSKDYGISWCQDGLPSLKQVKTLGSQFDLILLSAVWMHLSPPERKLSMFGMVDLLDSGGKLVITLRHGDFSDGRTAYPVKVEEVCEIGLECGLSVILKTELAEDQLGRGDVAWQTVVLGK